MSVSLTRTLSVIFGVIALALALYLVYRLKSKIDDQKDIARVEAQVIEKLKMIRDAQKAYRGVNGQYTSDWNKLISFIDTGSIYITEMKEEIITLAYGADSVHITIDTLGVVSVKDSLFSKQKYPDFNLQQLPLIPESKKGKRFAMFADKITKGGVLVDVVEVKDVDPRDKTRREDNEIRTKQPLRFGSQTDVTLSGNWPKDRER